MWNTALGKMIDVFSPLETYKVPFGMTKPSHKAGSFLVVLILTFLCLSDKVCGVFSNRVLHCIYDM